MPFVNSVPSLLATLDRGTWEHAVISYLDQHARGYPNAKPWDRICEACNIDIDQRAFQQGLLALTRDRDVFIGSGHAGYFIIENRSDALVMANFYQSRIAREQQHLTHLENLVRNQGWAPL